MIIEPITLTGNHVRLEPLSLDHHAALCEIGLDPDLWRWIPFQVLTPEDMRVLAQQMGEKGLRGPVEGPVLERMGAAISGAEAQARGFLALEDGSAERRLAELEKADQVDRLLAELKAKVNGAE